ncbi:MAG: TIGR04282 family arsenosugar biosynthesis glycosyltransferase [Nitrospinales bacterium]
MKIHPNALILFARVPRIGQVKTRLHPDLDRETICDLYKCFLQDSIENLCAVADADLFIGASPPEGLGYFDEIAASRGIAVFPQEGDDLGDKMRAAFCRRFAEGYDKIVIIGSDSPSLPPSYIETAFRSSRDVVLGPGADGGYYLIGMNRSLTEVFDGVSWGSERVLKATLKRIKKAGATLELLPLWYDVDTVEDLKFLKTHLALQSHCGNRRCGSTSEFLARLDL